jgi:hypothetical protein
MTIAWWMGERIEDRYSPDLAYTLRQIVQQIPLTGGVVGYEAPVGGGVGISAWHAVRSDGIGGLLTAAPTLGVVVLGITVTAGAPGASVQVVRTGIYDDVSWSWTPGVGIVLGASGELTQTVPPGAEVIAPLGVAITATKMLMRIDPTIAVG